MKKNVQKIIIRIIAALLILGLLLPLVAGAQERKPDALLAFQREWEAGWSQVSPGISQVPQYYQTDYYHINYRGGSLASGGCGIVCLAMAASYLKDREYTPDGLAARYSHLTGTNVDRYNAISQDLELPFLFLATKWSQVVQALEEGNLVVLLLNSGSVLTDTQHFVVLTGITSSGRILVMDPYEPNYLEYPRGFSRGFEQWQLSDGFDGAWVYRKQPRDAGFDARVLETYTGLWGKNPIAEIWFGEP